MSQPEAHPEQPNDDISVYFGLRPRRRSALILAILAFVAIVGLAFAVLLGSDIDVEPFVPQPGPDRVAGLGITPVGSAAVPQPSSFGLAQIDPGDAADAIPVRFGPGGEGVVVVPDGWNVLTRTDDRITLGNGDGVRFEARIVSVTPSTPATQLVAEAGTEIFSPADAADVRVSTVTGLQPFGALVSRSALGYSALRTDAQGVASVGGNVFAFVRDDGLALIVNPEVAPAAHWQPLIADWFPLWQSVVSNFAGAPLPA